jgi:hypothetical protein
MRGAQKMSRKKTPVPPEPSSTDKVKKLEDYQQSRPEQLHFFELLGLPNKPYSNSIELYDFVPKYVWRAPERENGK